MFSRRGIADMWNDPAPVREELFSIERLEEHAESLAEAQTVTDWPRKVLPLAARLDNNAHHLLAAYRASASAVEAGQEVVPAAEWLLDNYHVVEEQVWEIRSDLPPGYYKQLPKLADGPFAGYPRVFGIAWAFVAHTDSHFTTEALRSFLRAYQRVQPLTIGELWAVAITLRIVLIENLRRLSDQIVRAHDLRAKANELADRLLGVNGKKPESLIDVLGPLEKEPLSDTLAAQLARRFRDPDPKVAPIQAWLDNWLGQHNTSVEEVVRHNQQRQGASNVTVQNVVTSMRLISNTDWSELFESISLVDDRLNAGSSFRAMDFATHNLYRSAIEVLARNSRFGELEVAEKAIAKAEAARDKEDDERTWDPGYYLISGGRQVFEQEIDFHPPLRSRIYRLGLRLGIRGYVGAIVAVTFLMVLGVIALSWNSVASLWYLPLMIVLGWFPIMDTVVFLVNQFTIHLYNPTRLPALALRDGIPSDLRTMIVVPTLLLNEQDVLEQVEQLEVHHLASPEGDLSFALLTDWQDSDVEISDNDQHLLEVAANAILRLNREYGPAISGERFLLLRRRRLFNQGEGKWMGWERKRGKLHELNRLLRGATDTTFMPISGRAVLVPEGVRYVITLDADTRLPLGTVGGLVGKMSHPLNRPQFDAEQQRVVEGYAIMQPRVTPALPTQDDSSLYQRVFSSPGGMDPYASAVSDVYQDVFGEGTYTGKGIYDVDAFELSHEERIPENALLSHDLFESIFARAALITDVEFIEDFPSRYDVASKRSHRWARGDWQLLPWILGFTKQGLTGVTDIGQWKMVDNLRRALLAPMTFAALVLGWFMPALQSFNWIVLILAIMALPPLLPAMMSALSRRPRITRRSRFSVIGTDLKLACLLVVFQIAFVADQAWLMGDAIIRTLYRLFRSHKNLLEWVTSAQAGGKPRLSLFGFYRQMFGGVILVAIALAMAIPVFTANWFVILPLAFLWLAAPAIASLISRPPKSASRRVLPEEGTLALRMVARRTWRFFETFVTADNNMLPPDNFQEDPEPIVANRTSPTNLGLYLLSTVTARDFGWAGTMESIERLEVTLAVMSRMERFRGHFYNWYDTSDLRVLQPPYVSSVDSGNLGGHLIALANCCREWQRNLIDTGVIWSGIGDNLAMAREMLVVVTEVYGVRGAEIATALDRLEEGLARSAEGDPNEASLVSVQELAAEAEAKAEALLASIRTDAIEDMVFWTKAIAKGISEHHRDILYLKDAPNSMRRRLDKIAATAHSMALAMEFDFLLDPKRKMLAIGYAVSQNSLDTNCYDLLASEARLASLFAIAKGDVPSRHWFRLGRTATPIGKGAALISWSGSMFEYLMPALVMREPIGSLLDRTNHLVVDCQKAYGRAAGTPWGISESAYNARDIEFTYQYSNFGVPDLGLKRGLADNHVIAPYATGLATMFDPIGAIENYRALTEIGARGRYGYYDAVDFTKVRLQEGQTSEVVYNYMAHHQGMTIIAIANALQDRRMQERFHAEPMIHASELLLQERMPRHVALAPPRTEEHNVSPDFAPENMAIRRITSPIGTSPAAHLMSNGRYAVMVTSAGSGSNKWNNISVTRWREDASRDDWGSYIFLKDVGTGSIWSAGYQPTTVEPDHYEVIFSEDRAEFIRRDGALTTVMDVLVSAEDNGEVRRITVSNAGPDAREIELTSYAELVLVPADSDVAHPAFSKMFVQTEYMPEFGALIATRRPRTSGEPPIWAAHVAVIEKDHLREPVEYETDRARFLGRGHTIKSASAIWNNEKLSNTVGTVLDPIFSLRHRIKIGAGKMARIAFWTIVASSREELISLIDVHRGPGAFERAMTMAWTQAQVQLRHLNISPIESTEFQHLAGHIVYTDPRLRPPSDLIKQGLGPQTGLWPQGISGDLPIMVIRIDDVEDIEVVRQLIRAHEYWNLKGLAVDLVIINERVASYMQDLQNAIEAEVRASQPRLLRDDRAAGGAIFTLRSDLMSGETRSLLHSVARVVLTARRGLLADQFARLEEAPSAIMIPMKPRPVPSMPLAVPTDLEFFNGLGGFAKDGREYVIVLQEGHSTPAPWINVVANSGFGFHVAAEGSGYTWAVNSREYQLTPWSNDPVANSPSEAFYIRDDESGDLFCPTAAPIRDNGTYIARHGRGYSRFEHAACDIGMDLLQFVPVDDAVKISRLKLKNLSDRRRALSVTAYLEWVLGVSRGTLAPYIITEMGPVTGAMLARNPWSIPFGTRVAFVDMGGRQTRWTGDRREFLGRNGRLASPAALYDNGSLSGQTGAGFDPCAALQSKIVLDAGETTEIVFVLGDADSVENAKELIQKYREADLDEVLAKVGDYWEDILGAVQVKTPDRAMDVMLNNWLLYQTLACRVTARSAFYQASGAYGFRDQLQDGMALTFTMPEVTRGHLVRAAGRQFAEGDVQHWWLPHSGQGVRTRISDDCVWLAYGVASYIEATGDKTILDEMIPFLEGQKLAEGEHDAFFLPMQSEETGTLFEHCARGLEQCIALTGRNGLPLIGTGDWNDGMNRVGEHGRGESIWLGWLFLKAVEMFAPMVESRDPDRVSAWRIHTALVGAALEQNGWDGEWYRRGYFDDGTPFGSASSDECMIDSIAQSWAVLSGAAEPERARQAMESLEKHLIRYDEGIALLFTPPFDKTAHDPGYIKGYPPGLRENGGQYTHAAMWTILAFAKQGQGDKAARLFSALNPVNHALTQEDRDRYKVEPYVVAADVYSVPPHNGRGGWTWYTGSAGWMYRAGLEGILGLQQVEGRLLLDPCIPADWPGFSLTIRRGETVFDIEVENPSGVSQGVGSAILDGAAYKLEKGKLFITLDERKHKLVVTLGQKAPAKRSRRKSSETVQ